MIVTNLLRGDMDKYRRALNMVMKSLLNGAAKETTDPGILRAKYLLEMFTFKISTGPPFFVATTGKP